MENTTLNLPPLPEDMRWVVQKVMTYGGYVDYKVSLQKKLPPSWLDIFHPNGRWTPVASETETYYKDKDTRRALGKPATPARLVEKTAHNLIRTYEEESKHTKVTGVYYPRLDKPSDTE